MSPLWKVFHEIPLMLSWVCFFHRGSKIPRWFWSFFTEAPKFLSAFDQSLIFYRFKSKCEVIAGGFVIKHTNSRHFRQYLDRLLPSGWQCGPNYSTWPTVCPELMFCFSSVSRFIVTGKITMVLTVFSWGRKKDWTRVRPVEKIWFRTKFSIQRRSTLWRQ